MYRLIFNDKKIVFDNRWQEAIRQLPSYKGKRAIDVYIQCTYKLDKIIMAYLKNIDIESSCTNV